MRKYKQNNGSTALYVATLMLIILVFVIVNVKEIEKLEENNYYKTKGITVKKINGSFEKVSHSFPSFNNTKKTKNILSRKRDIVTQTKFTTKLASEDAYAKYDKFIRHSQMVDEFASNFSIHPSKKCNEDTTLVILVNSRAGSRVERSKIRSYFKSHKSIKVYFLVGKYFSIKDGRPKSQKEYIKPFISEKLHMNSSSLRINDMLFDEAVREGDLIVPNLVDNYNSLTTKIGSGFLWVLKYCAHSDCVLKMDDDVFINYKLLEKAIKDQQPYSILGKVCRNCIPFNPGGLEESENLFSHSFVLTRNHFPLSQLPFFVFGPAYVVHTNLLPALLVTALELDALPYYEDVFWTGLTTAELKIKTNRKEFNLIEQIGSLKLQNRHRKDTTELLKFLESVCSQPNSKFAVSASTLSLIKLIDLPFWRTELHRCLKGRNCSTYTTLHGVSWKDETLLHVISSS